MKLSRRTLLRRAAGTGAALVFADALSPIAKAGTLSSKATTRSNSPSSPFFLFGARTADTAFSEPFVAMGDSSDVAAAPVVVARPVAAIPIRSPDRTVLSIINLQQDASEAHLSVAFLDTGTGTVTRRGTIDLVAVSSDVTVLVTPAFSADSTTLCIVLSLTVPTDKRTIDKFNPLTGGTLSMTAATWVSHHAILYFDGDSGSFNGPFDLTDAPSLARVNAQANATDLFLWTIDEPAAVFRTKGRAAQPPVPRLSAFPLGSGTPHFTTPAPGPWPVNGEPTAILSTGDIGRLVYGKYLQIYTTTDGTARTIAVAQLDAVPAKPAAITMEARNDGLLLFAAPAIGRAALIDPRRSFQAVSTITFAIPYYATGGPTSKTALSDGSDAFYVLGGADSGGVVAYDVDSGMAKASFSTGQHFYGIQQLPSGELLAVAPSSPRLSLLDPSLKLIAHADVDMRVAALL